MLTIRQNLIETIKGGNPDRFVKQFEPFKIIYSAPIIGADPGPGEEIKDGWGVTVKYTEGQIGAFPVLDDEHLVIKDIKNWKKYVKAPSLEYTEQDWAEAKAQANSVDRNNYFVTAAYYCGIFERLHYLMGMEETFANLYEEPESMKELINYIADYEIEYAKVIINHIQPDAIYRHDDWGGQRSSFFSPEMFKEFFLEPTKKIYDFYRSNGVELIIHHADSYAANLVPHMIDMGIDIWQGAMSTNNIPELIKKYGDKITFMGGLDSGAIDFPEWKRDIVDKSVEEICKSCGSLYFIPNLTQGLDWSTFEGVYEAVDNEIERMSKEMFNC